MRIGDAVVRNAIETIVSELEAAEARIAELQNTVQSLETTIEMKDHEIDQLQNDVAELDAEVKRLDDALADTYVSQLDPNAKRETD